MKRRTLTSASLSAALVLGGFGIVVTAQEPVDDLESQEEVAEARSTTGTIVAVEEDGRTVYYLDPGDGSELIMLSHGPSWFWGELNPLDSLAGQEAEIGGQLRDGMPDEHASDPKEKAAKAPKLKVQSINGEKRKGKPAWAGGPKKVGESHTGYAGWSRGQAAKSSGPSDAGKPDGVGKPD
jgi:hypothetical protein